MLFLNKDAIQKIDQNSIQTAVEQAYRLVLSQNYNMPDRMHVADNQNILLLMPCFSEKFFSTKLVSVFPEAQQHGQPAVNGVMVLSDNVSGQPLAVMDGAAVTAQRTGAVGGLGVKLLTPETVRAAGVLGAGVQGLSQARYLLFNRKIKTLYIYDLYKESAINMTRVLKKEYPDVDYVITENANQLVENSSVIIAATTSSNPLFETTPDGVMGKIFISIGSFRPDMQEFPDTVIETADDVFVDTLFAAKESGDIATPLKKHVITKNKIKEFAGLLGKNTYPENRTVFFKSVGMALFDLTVSSAIYQLAVKNNIGQALDF
ncbi:ornithine cyclodeaminase family protein [Desulfobacula sp.]|uniref:ornithine cyclodeaminase family protein n=1 Tax=Desulfobacula sp. TaxID=2593537 RepID=UPI0025C30057|nr:ornithine cyclodeaminase family protein [Desulfobacula sp.]MBC2705341.1 ornithine cyclodeaminase family protein [Desulfobacula sp.]